MAWILHVHVQTEDQNTQSLEYKNERVVVVVVVVVVVLL